MDNFEEILSKLGDIQKTKNGYLAHCPAHEDKRKSLSISKGCDDRILLHCHAGCKTEDVVDTLGLKMLDLYEGNNNFYDKKERNIIKTYDYQDKNGRLLFQVCRKKSKKFFLRRPDDKSGYINNLGNINPVLYRLPELLDAVKDGQTIYITEGEKDVDNLVNLGLVATTNPMGAGKWKDSYSVYLKDANVVILPDNDEAGKKHSNDVASSLQHITASLKILQLPNLPEKGDVSDWISNGGSIDELIRLANDAPFWEQNPANENSKSDRSKCEAESKPSQSDLLVEIGKNNSILFHDETREPYACFKIHDHQEIWRTASKQYKRWLVNLFYTKKRKAPGNESIRQALNVIEAEALYQGEQHMLDLRVADRNGVLYYDLADEEWRIVKIEPGNWCIENEPQIIFKRFKNTAPQVEPQKGGNLDLLRKYINLSKEMDWILLKALIVAAFVPKIPHPIPVFFGDKGSAKTTAQRVLRKLIDPAIRDTMSMPTNKNEFALTLMTNYAPCFDNLDRLTSWQSDMLCLAVTGGGISKRELYTDIDEVILSFQRCPMVNGINNVVLRDDLLDRSILFQLQRINPTERKEESIFWKEFEQDRPKILGAVFDTLAQAVPIKSELKLQWLPRMADFARLGYAISQIIDGNGEDFLNAYRENIAGAVEEAIQADQVATAVSEFMNERVDWEGTMTNLLEELNEVPGVDSKAKSWPKRAHILSRRINTMKSSLADVGIKTENYRNKDGRCIKLLNTKNEASQEAQATQDSTLKNTRHDATGIQTLHSVNQASDGKPIFEKENDDNDCSADNAANICINDGDCNSSKCEHCGEPIEWVTEGNKHVAMLPDYTGFHKCKSKVTSL